MRAKSGTMTRMILGALLVSSLGGCAMLHPMDPTEAIQGTWTSDKSVAVYEIGMVDGQMQVRGYSSQSGREMVIGNVSWDGSVLRFTSYMPATDRRVEHVNRLRNRNTMESTGTSGTSHRVIWKKDQ